MQVGSLILFREEGPAPNSFDTENLEKVGGNQHAEDPFPCLPPTQGKHLHFCGG